MYGTQRTELVLIRCCVCKRWVAVRVDPDDLERHANGLFVQFAFADRNGVPYLSAADREMLLSATCGACWAVLCVDPIAHQLAYN